MSAPQDVEALVAFVRARLDEDDQLARAAGGRALVEPYPDHDDEPDGMWWTHDHQDFQVEASHATIRHVAHHGPARVLRDVAAHRELLHQLGMAQRNAEDYRRNVDDAAAVARAQAPRDALLRAVSALAAVHVDHPDFQAEWAP